MTDRIGGVNTLVFDAYGTLFDVNAAARTLSAELGERWTTLTALWRQKQLQYTWLRSAMDRHADFWDVTQAGLDYALAATGGADPALRSRLLDLYWRCAAFPEVPGMLRTMKDRGYRLAILSNGSPAMLAGAVSAAGLEGVFDAVLSVESVGAFKPARAVYQLVPAHFGISRKAVCFQSSNAWDAAAAAEFGFRVCWVNRAGDPPEQLPWAPDATLRDLAGLPDLLPPTPETPA